MISLGRSLPFCLDVTPATFEKLDLLLRTLCEGLDRSEGSVVYPPPHQDQECMALATLNLLKLQVHILEKQFLD